MGIMSNKVSRRVALGTIAGGLAGTAIIVHALKGKYKVNVSDEGKYATEWKKYVKRLDVPIRKTDGPATFSLDFKPQMDMQCHAIFIFAAYNGQGVNLMKYPQLPFCFSVAEADVATRAPVVDDTPALSINGNLVSLSPTVHDEIPRGTCVVVPRDGGADYFEVSRGTLHKIATAKVNVGCVAVGEVFAFDYPKRKSLSNGAKWSIPKAASPYPMELSCQCVGFAQIAERETVLMSAERQMNNQEVQDYLAGMAQ
jgi:hypothetical protein